MPVNLAAAALETENGEALIVRCVRRMVLIDLANADPDAERAIAAGMYEAGDDGGAMAEALVAEMPERECRRLALWARDHALRRCEIAAGELMTAANTLCVDVDPEAVALLAAGPAVGRAMR